MRSGLAADSTSSTWMDGCFLGYWSGGGVRPFLPLNF